MKNGTSPQTKDDLMISTLSLFPSLVHEYIFSIHSSEFPELGSSQNILLNDLVITDAASLSVAWSKSSQGGFPRCISKQFFV